MTISSLASRRLYVQRVLELYRVVPGTTGQARRSDRSFAAQLHDRGIALDVVVAALLLTVARRTFRSSSAPRLAPIATLHYFQPVIDEIIANPPEDGYLGYIRYRLSTAAPSFVAALDHLLP
jgi:hypothetical protein